MLANPFGKFTRELSRILVILPSSSSCILDHWVEYYLVKRHYSFSSPFESTSFRLRLLEQKAKCLYLADSQAFLVMLRLQLQLFFTLFVFFLCLSVHTCTNTPNTWYIIVFIIYWDKISDWGHYLHQINP